MASEYSFVEGDTGSTYRHTCKDADGNIIDLTDFTATLIWKNKAGALVERAMDIVAPASSGVVEYLFLANELEAGTMFFTIRLTDSASRGGHNLNYLQEKVRARQVAAA